MIELFSAKPHGLKLPEDFHFTKVAVDQGVFELPDAIRTDVTAYLEVVHGDASFDPRASGVPMSKQDGATLLRTVYRL